MRKKRSEVFPVGGDGGKGLRRQFSENSINITICRGTGGMYSSLETWEGTKVEQKHLVMFQERFSNVTPAKVSNGMCSLWSWVEKCTNTAHCVQERDTSPFLPLSAIIRKLDRGNMLVLNCILPLGYFEYSMEIQLCISDKWLLTISNLSGSEHANAQLHICPWPSRAARRFTRFCGITSSQRWPMPAECAMHSPTILQLCPNTGKFLKRTHRHHRHLANVPITGNTEGTVILWWHSLKCSSSTSVSTWYIPAF